MAAIKKHVTAGRNGATARKAATLDARLNRFVKREESRGAYRHFRDPAKALAELRTRSKKPRHALRVAAA
jgi:hypothetical protein